MWLLKEFKFFLFFLFSIKLALAQNYYVSDSNGSDNNSGTIELPFKTINKGISMVNPGGTVYVMDGIYQNANYGSADPSTNTNMNNQHVVTINKSGTEGAYITIRNYPGHLPKIQFDGRGGIVISNGMNLSPYIIFLEKFSKSRKLSFVSILFRLLNTAGSSGARWAALPFSACSIDA